MVYVSSHQEGTDREIIVHIVGKSEASLRFFCLHDGIADFHVRVQSL